MSYYSNLYSIEENSFIEKSKVYSHKSKKLEEHLLNVAKNSAEIFNSLCIKNKNLYTNISFLIGLSHDFAKSTTYFQKHLFNKDFKTKKSQHGYLSAIFGYYVVKNYILENNIKCLLNFPALSYLIILKHHGNLQNIEGTSGEINKIKTKKELGKEQILDIKNNIANKNNKDLKSFYNNFNIDLDSFFESFDYLIDDIEIELENLVFDEDINNYVYLILFYSILLDSDKIDASETTIYQRKDIPSDIVDEYKKEKFKDQDNGINKIREEAYKEVVNKVNSINLDNKIYSIDLPTGTGKTLTAFSFALKLKERINNELGFNPRIIYSLPFLSIIDQNEEVISDILSKHNLIGSNILLKHHYLSDMNFKIEEDKELDLNNSKILIEGWHSEIIITTFIQFFYSLISNKNRSLRKFHNMVNSIIILDEIQAVPYEYWLLINKILKKLAHEFNTYIILMTATQPLIFNENLREIIPLVDNKNKYYKSFDRVNYNFNMDDINFDNFKNKIIKEIENNSSKDIMVVLNTINQSKELYECIKYYFNENFNNLKVDLENGICFVNDEIQLVYLSTNIIPKHRLERISKIKNSNKRNIIISTQLVEAGVDISVDIVYRDLAPLDSIIQTAGRCNRNNDFDKGIVNVVSLVNEKNRKFSTFVYKSILINTTKELLENKEFCSEKDFNLKASNKYNEYLDERTSKKSSKDLLKIIENLKFSQISQEFKLIDDDFEKIDVFISIDNDAERVWNKFKEIKSNKNLFKQKNEFLKIKSDFYKYVISINNKNDNLGSAQIEDETLAFLTFDDLKRKYDIETGFLYQKDENTFII